MCKKFLEGKNNWTVTITVFSIPVINILKHFSGKCKKRFDQHMKVTGT